MKNDRTLRASDRVSTPKLVKPFRAGDLRPDQVITYSNEAPCDVPEHGDPYYPESVAN